MIKKGIERAEYVKKGAVSCLHHFASVGRLTRYYNVEVEAM